MPKPKPTLWISLLIWAHWEHSFKSIIVNLENKLLTFTIVQPLSFIYAFLFFGSLLNNTTSVSNIIYLFIFLEVRNWWCCWNSLAMCNFCDANWEGGGGRGGQGRGLFIICTFVSPFFSQLPLQDSFGASELHGLVIIHKSSNYYRVKAFP
jgi:hypothetical protein